MGISATFQVFHELYKPYCMSCNNNHNINKLYFPLLSQVYFFNILYQYIELGAWLPEITRELQMAGSLVYKYRYIITNLGQ